jgi:hypothetical protein
MLRSEAYLKYVSQTHFYVDELNIKSDTVVINENQLKKIIVYRGNNRSVKTRKAVITASLIALPVLGLAYAVSKASFTGSSF